MDIEISDVGHMIQLAIAPVFLLTGVGTMLVVLTNRLARIIDRTRVVEQRIDDAGNEPACLEELETLYRRSWLVNIAITSNTVCALLVCLVIAMLFLGDSTNLPLDQYIAACFVLAMIMLIASFLYFLREVFIASRYLRAVQRKALR